MSETDLSAKEQEVQRAKWHYDNYIAATDGFDVAKQSIHMAMLRLRDMTAHLPMPDAIAAIGDIQKKFGVLFEELSRNAFMMNGIAASYKQEYHRLTGVLP